MPILNHFGGRRLPEILIVGWLTIIWGPFFYRKAMLMTQLHITSRHYKWHRRTPTRITISVTPFCKREKLMQLSPITREQYRLFRRILTSKSASAMLFGKKEKPKKQSIITGKRWNYVLTTSARIII